MVAQQLQGNGGEQGRQGLVGRGNRNELVAHRGNGVAAFAGDGVDAAFAGLYLLHVAHKLVIKLSKRSDNDYGHVLVNQGNGAVLHFGSRVALCVDVADFFKL